MSYRGVSPGRTAWCFEFCGSVCIHALDQRPCHVEESAAVLPDWKSSLRRRRAWSRLRPAELRASFSQLGCHGSKQNVRRLTAKASAGIRHDRAGLKVTD